MPRHAKVTTKKCMVCGKEFRVTPCVKKECCSKECGYKFRKIKNGTVKACGVCGAEFRVTPSDKDRRFCSRQCMSVGMSGDGSPIKVRPLYRKCKNCEKKFQINGSSDVRKKMYCSYQCCVEDRRKNGHPTTVPVGTRTKYPDGYVHVKVAEGKWVPEHIVVAEKSIGRPMMSNEVVHHRNGIHDDNRPENLKVVTKSEHQRIHWEAEQIGLRVMATEGYEFSVEGMAC